MTGNVPYYGGRFTPAQAYAASHPNQPVPRGVPSGQDVLYGRAPVPGQQPPADAGQSEPDSRAALQQLLTSGVITQAEFDQLQARVPR
jgi:hypothetical protein